MPHDSKYLQTIQIPHNVGDFVPIEETKIWEFMEKALIDDDNKNMILTYMAYCLTLQAGLKTFMVLSGQSNTGKSVLIRFIENLVGKHNTSALSMHELNMRFYPSQLYGRLLNSCADNSSLPLSAIENLKKITGGDQIMHEKKGKEPFFFVPFAKLLFSFNQLPLQLEEKSDAFYKRMRILSMTNELFLDDEYVNDLCSEESVSSVIPYLLSLLPVKEIPRTKLSDQLVEGMRKDSDSIHSFMEDKCDVGKGFIIPKTALYDSYAKYCFENDREAHKKHAFMRRLRALQFKEVRHPKSREACWKGIRLKTSSKKKGGNEEC
jgi:P4 family phage/plasmid primase-like protien